MDKGAFKAPFAILMGMACDERLDLIALANGIRADPATPGGDADLMAFLIGELCELRDLPVSECLTRRRSAVLQHYDADHYAVLAERHGWRQAEDEV